MKFHSILIAQLNLWIGNREQQFSSPTSLNDSQTFFFLFKKTMHQVFPRYFQGWSMSAFQHTFLQPRIKLNPSSFQFILILCGKWRLNIFQRANSANIGERCVGESCAIIPRLRQPVNQRWIFNPVARSRGSGVSGELPIYSPFTADDSNSVTAKYTGDLPEATP